MTSEELMAKVAVRISLFRRPGLRGVWLSMHGVKIDVHIDGVPAYAFDSPNDGYGWMYLRMDDSSYAARRPDPEVVPFGTFLLTEDVPGKNN